MTSQKVMLAKFLQELRETDKNDQFLKYMSTSKFSLQEIFEKVWNHDLTEKILRIPEGNPNISKKGQAESESFRNAGNKLYKERKLAKALLAYNYAILSAPHPKEKFDNDTNNNIVYTEEHECELPGYECLSLAYANRSVLLVDMEQYRTAMDDISNCIKYGYPKNKRHKLMERKSKCLIALGKYDEAKILLEKILATADELKLDKKDINAIKNNAEKLIMKCNESLDLKNKGKTSNQKKGALSDEAEKYSKIFYRGPETTPRVSSPRENYPSISKAVMVKYSPTKGRYLVATQDIEPG